MHVLITGANRGIGAQLASDFRARGDEVTGTSRSGEIGLQMDVTDPTSVTGAARALGGKAVDLLVCNAGVYLDRGHQIGAGYDAPLWGQTFAANVTGVFLTIEAFLPNLKAAQNGRIAIISSQMASSQNAPGGSYMYRASKAAALNLGRNLAQDLHADGLAVGIYHPGWVRTDMGGSVADIDVETASAGLVAQLDWLNLATTGIFADYQGKPIPY